MRFLDSYYKRSIQKTGTQKILTKDLNLEADIYKFPHTSTKEEAFHQILFGYFTKNAAHMGKAGFIFDSLSSSDYEKKTKAEKVRLITDLFWQLMFSGGTIEDLRFVGEEVFYDHKGKLVTGIDRLIEFYNNEQNLFSKDESILESSILNNAPEALTLYNSYKTLGEDWKVYTNKQKQFMAAYRRNLLIFGPYDNQNELIQNLGVIDKLINEKKIKKWIRHDNKSKFATLFTGVGLGGIGGITYILVKPSEKQTGALIMLSLSLGLPIAAYIGHTLYNTLDKRKYTKKLSNNAHQYLFGIVKEKRFF